MYYFVFGICSDFLRKMQPNCYDVLEGFLQCADNKIFNEYAVLVSRVVFCQYAHVLYLIYHKQKEEQKSQYHK